MVWISLDSGWNVMAHDDAREGEWRGNWRMKWVASTLHTTSEHGVSSITTADAHTSAASSLLNDAPSVLNGLVRLAEKWNLVSARAPSYFNWPLPNTPVHMVWNFTHLVFSYYVIQLLPFVRYSFVLIVLLHQQVSVQNIATYCLKYQFKTTRLQLCGHDMLMCSWVCEKNTVRWQSFTAEHWCCTIIFL